MSKVVIEAKNIDKYFHDPVSFHVLKDVDFTIHRGEFVSIIGKSGSGKSTLLYILSTMDSDYKGELYIDEELMNDKSNDYLSMVRNEKIGFVFQFHYLLPDFNVLKNIMLPALKLGKHSRKEIEERAMEHLKSLGMEKLSDRNSNQLSGGEKQRVAIARALINDPLIIMCDEPTGNLDKKNTEIVFDILHKLKKSHQTLLVVTHDQDFSSRTDRVIEIDYGKILRS